MEVVATSLNNEDDQNDFPLVFAQLIDIRITRCNHEVEWVGLVLLCFSMIFMCGREAGGAGLALNT